MKSKIYELKNISAIELIKCLERMIAITDNNTLHFNTNRSIEGLRDEYVFDSKSNDGKLHKYLAFFEDTEDKEKRKKEKYKLVRVLTQTY